MSNNEAYCDTKISDPVLAYDNEPEDRHSVRSKMWAIYGNDCFVPCDTAVSQLTPGQYTIDHSQQYGFYFRRVDTMIDDLIHLPDNSSDQVMNEIRSFWGREAQFRKYGFLWKRGVLLWGPPGSGKTATLQLISQEIIKNGGISVYVDHPGAAAQGLKVLRTIEKTRPLVVMLEDIDAIIDQHGESGLLALMDGELQIDNVVFVATTNYPERLDKRFVCRPSRFDLVMLIDTPSDDARKTYITAKSKVLSTPKNKQELSKWVKATKGFSIAHVKELIVSVEVFGVAFEDALERLKKMVEKAPKSDSRSKGAFGFIRDDDEEDEDE